MSLTVRCDGCGGWPDQAAVQARRRRDLDGDTSPPPEFDWCRMCARVAFDAVHAAARQRAARRAAEDRRPRPGLLPPVDVTAVLERRPEVPAVAALRSWLPRGRSGEETAIMPVRGRVDD